VARKQTVSEGELCVVQRSATTSSSCALFKDSPGENRLDSHNAGYRATTLGRLSDGEPLGASDVDRAVRKELVPPVSVVIITGLTNIYWKYFSLNDFPENGMPLTAGVLSVSPTGTCRYSNFAL